MCSLKDYKEVRFGILTVSDRCSRNEAEDLSGQKITEFIKERNVGYVVKRSCVADEIYAIQDKLISWSNSGEVDVILTCGGTGFSQRDVTPEATKKVIEKEAPGIIISIISKSLEITKMAMLSRPVCGIRRNSIILNLPGSSKGCIECLEIVIDQIKHIVNLIHNDLEKINHEHSIIDSNKKKYLKSKVNAVNIADRDRKSQFESILVEKAQEIVLENLPSPQIQSVLTKNSLGFILAEDVKAQDNLPPFRASVKDGYAVKCHPNMSLLHVLGGSTAGDNLAQLDLNETNCVRISTGAPLPSEADSVVQVEDTELIQKSEDGNDEKIIKLNVQPVPGEAIREIGSDIKFGDVVLHKGKNLGPAELGILAAIGVSSVKVYKKPTIALLSTGNELQDPSASKLLPGHIRDSNKTVLAALFKEAGYTTVDIGIAKDNPDEVYSKLVESFEKANVVVTTGGVSMGECDFLRHVLTTDLNAKIHFGSILMKPGKPTKFSTCKYKGEDKIVFALPGNPVSATVTAQLFVIPACKKISGSETPHFAKIKAKVSSKLKLDFARPEYHRGILEWTCDSDLPTVHSTGNQASSRLLSCATSNTLLCLPKATENKKEINVGDTVNCLWTSSGY